MKKIFIFLSLCFFIIQVNCQVKLPKLISNGMVLQRNSTVRIWGWAANKENITISFLGKVYKTIADDRGNWKVSIRTRDAGGPYSMKIKASNEISIDNILLGEVWVCSGQSNMELPIRRVRPVYETELKNVDNDKIRQFQVPQKYNFKDPQNDLTGGSWVSATSGTIDNFSAVAYFYAKELYNTYKVPVGLINASLGGSPVEAWMSKEALQQFPDYLKEAEKFKDDDLIKQIEEQDNQRISAWYKLMQEKDEAYKDPEHCWTLPELNTTGWQRMNIPGYWANTSLGEVNGVVWFRRKIDIPYQMAGKKSLLIMGRIVDADSVFVNGKFIGTTSYQYPPRRYSIPENLLKEGENTIVVKIISNAGKGGFVPDKTYEIVTGETHIDLKGEWQFKLGAKMDPLGSQTFIRWKPEGLFNAMIHPLLNYSIKGVIWYQGESNTSKPSDYKDLFPAMIKDWRDHWQSGDFPFLYVQLANFMESKPEPSESDWALLREAQLKTLTLPNTGMAVIIDIGEWNDIHPLNKKDVGHRLALAAQRIAYGDKTIVSSGPVYKSMSVKGNKIILTFNNIGSGLISRSDDLKNFAIAGADKKFVWAKAVIQNNKVIVWNENISRPVAVRYAWADNPEDANLYNKEGLPASPFRTDTE